MGVGHPCFVPSKVFQEIKISLSFSLHLIINLGNSITLSFLNFDLKSGFIYLFSYPWIFLAIFWIIHISLYKKEKKLRVRVGLSVLFVSL